MPKPPPRKPLFCPPVVNVARPNSKEEVHSKPKPGEIGWQESMAKRMENDTEDGKMFEEIRDQPKMRPKPGEEGWLQAMVDNSETSSTQDYRTASQPQQLDTSRAEVVSAESSSQVLQSQEEGRRPQPGEPGWLVAIANNTENREDVMKLNQVQDSRDMFSSNSNQEAPSKKPGEPGWLVSIAENLEDDCGLRQQGNEGGKNKKGEGKSKSGQEKIITQHSQEKNMSSQDSGIGKNTTSTQTSRSSTSHASSQSSASSMFDLLGSQEVASQVLSYQEKVVKDSQASVDREDTEEHSSRMCVTIGDKVDKDIIEQGQEGTTNVDSLTSIASIVESSNQAIVTSSSSQLSSMLDKIISDIKEKRSIPEQQVTCDEAREQEIEAPPPTSLPPCGGGSGETSQVEQSKKQPLNVITGHEEMSLPDTATIVVQNNSADTSESDTSSRSATMDQDNEDFSKEALTPSPQKHSKGSKVVYQFKPQEYKKVTQVVSKAPKKVAQKFKAKPMKKGSFIQNRTPILPGAVGHRKGRGEDVKKALLTLQKMRTACTWVMCSKVECGKWRYLSVKDPCLVEDGWECKDNSDRRYGECSAPEQWWDQGLKNKFVENRFTVGSMVWARMEGWPAWPAMVDDDPETGEFFWTGLREGEWELKPTYYHVVFFDAKDKTVSRAWIPDRRMEKMVVGDKMKGQWNARLAGAVEMAKQAGREDLDTRRKKYCLATRFRGPWGSVWPDFGKKEESNEDSDMENEEELCREMIEEVIKNQNNNISLTHDESISDVLKVLPGKKRPNTSTDDQDRGSLKAAKSTLGSTSEKSATKEISPSKENVPPPTNISKLYADKSLYTQEMSQQPSVSFTSDGGDGDNLDRSLKLGMDNAMHVLDNLTPIKKNKPVGPGILKEREVKTPNNKAIASIHSPAIASPQLITPGEQAPFKTSTPARKTSMISHGSKSLLSPGGDVHPLNIVADGCPMNTTSGSTAFSADGSFIDL